MSDRIKIKIDDNDPITLQHFLSINDGYMDPVVEEIKKMDVDESKMMGGGALPSYEVTRVE